MGSYVLVNYGIMKVWLLCDVICFVWMIYYIEFLMYVVVLVWFDVCL